MPQLDVYTFSTQIYDFSDFTLTFIVLFSYTFTYVLFFESEIFERHETLLSQSPLSTQYELTLFLSRHAFLSNRLVDVFALFFRQVR